MKRLLITAAAVSLIAITGCGSTSSSSSPNGSGGNGGGSGAAGDLSNLAAKFQKISFKGTYTYSGGGSNGTYTIYWMPPSSSRFDVVADGDTTTMIQVSKTSYVCSAGQCLKTDSGTNDAASNPVTSLFSSQGGIAAAAAAASAGGASVKTSHQSIAGMDGTCYTAAASGATWEYCLSNDGLLLLASTDGYTLKAQSVSTDVKSSDFDPPSPVEDLGNLVPTP